MIFRYSVRGLDRMPRHGNRTGGRTVGGTGVTTTVFLQV